MKKLNILLATGLVTLMAGCSSAPTVDEVNVGLRNQRMARDMIEEGKATVEEGKAQVREGKAQIQEGKTMMREGKEQINEGNRQMEEGERMLGNDASQD